MDLLHFQEYQQFRRADLKLLIRAISCRLASQRPAFSTYLFSSKNAASEWEMCRKYSAQDKLERPRPVKSPVCPMTPSVFHCRKGCPKPADANSWQCAQTLSGSYEDVDEFGCGFPCLDIQIHSDAKGRFFVIPESGFQLAAFARLTVRATTVKQSCDLLRRETVRSRERWLLGG